MVYNPRVPHDESLDRFRRVVESALDELENRRQEVNDLNVFPVADGDTGDNMALTMRAVVEELSALDGASIDDVSRDEIVSAVARAALLGARGNSGVILSQIVRGAAEELASRPGELVDPVLMSAALARAADAAYASVRDPAEGTMLSAVRAMASRVAHDLAHMDTQRLGPEADRGGAGRAARRGARARARGRQGGRGARARAAGGAARVRRGRCGRLRAHGDHRGMPRRRCAGWSAPKLEHQYAPAALHRPEHESSSFQYCTNFAVTGERLEAGHFTPLLEQLGDSVLVVGDDRTLRVHVHTDDPDARGGAVRLRGRGVALRRGRHVRAGGRAQRSARRRGGGRRAGHVRGGGGRERRGRQAAVQELGVLVVDGGSTMNPSTYELLAGIHAAPGVEVVVLPNSPNVILAAERAAELSEKPASVVPTTAPQEGLAALLAFDPARPSADNALAVRSAADALRIGGVAPAARDDVQGRFIAGEAVGYAGGELVAWGDPAATLAATLDRIVDGAELVTCIAGEKPPLGQHDVEASVPDGVEVEYHEGGQPAWWWLLCAE